MLVSAVLVEKVLDVRGVVAVGDPEARTVLVLVIASYNIMRYEGMTIDEAGLLIGDLLVMMVESFKAPQYWMSALVVVTSWLVTRPFGAIVLGVSPAGRHCAKRRRDHQMRARAIMTIVGQVSKFRLPFLQSVDRKGVTPVGGSL